MVIKCCKDCNDRVLGCHSTCKTYLDAKAEFEKAKEERRRQRKIDNDATEFFISKAYKEKRRKGGK